MARAWRSVAGGMLTTAVRVERATGVIGPGGGTIPGEPEVIADRIAAAIEPLSVGTQLREHLASGATETHVTHLVRMPRLPAADIRASDVLYELQPPARQLEIVSRIEDVIADEVHLICVEQEAA